MSRRVKELVDMEIDEISLVDRPANAHAKVIISKSEGGAMPEDLYDEYGNILDVDELDVGDVVFDEDGDALMLVDEDDLDYEEVGKAARWKGSQRAVEWMAGQGSGNAQAILRGQSRRANPSGVSQAKKVRGAKETVARDDRGISANLLARTGKRVRMMEQRLTGDNADVGIGRGLSEGWRAGGANRHRMGVIYNNLTPGGQRAHAGAEHVSRHRKGYAIGAAGVGAAGLGGGGAYAYNRERVGKSFAEELREEISKASSDWERDEVISKMADELDYISEAMYEAEEVAKSERDLRLMADYYEVAKSYGVPVDPEELAPVLLMIAEELPYEYAEVVHKALAASGEIATQAFAEIGYGGQATNNDVLHMVDAYIDENIAKTDYDISKAEAVSAVFEANPMAYDEYMASRY